MTEPLYMTLGGWKSPTMLSRDARLSPVHLWNAVDGFGRQQTGSTTGSGAMQPRQGAVEVTELLLW